MWYGIGKWINCGILVVLTDWVSWAVDIVKQ